MSHPTSAQVQKVIDNFKSALPLATMEGHICHSEPRVCSWNYKAGTIHCHGGWYVVGSRKLKRRRMSVFAYIEYRLKNRGKFCAYRGILFDEGIEQMERDLGNIEIRIWAQENPVIWGNDKGEKMFGLSGNKLAFQSTKRPNGATCLQEIVDHWEEVRDRLIVLEKQVEISDPPVTIEDFIGLGAKIS